MENVHATDHCWLIHERQLVNCPRCSTKLSIHLDQHLGDDWSEILASLDGTRENHLGRNWEFSQEEFLDIIIQVAPSFWAWKNQHYHLHSFIQLILEGSDPSIYSHSWTNLTHPWFWFLIAALVKTLLHCALELVGNLSITVTMENTPSLQLCLAEHLSLNLPINLTHVLLNVKWDWCSTWSCSHQQLSSLILEALQLLRLLSELQMPELLLLNTFGIGLKVGHQVLDFFDLGVSICMHNLS